MVTVDTYFFIIVSQSIISIWKTCKIPFLFFFLAQELDYKYVYIEKHIIICL
jgi:hypothetical protein